MSAAPATSAAARPAGRLGVLVFVALVLASFAAFFLAQRLKHIPTAVQDLKLDAAFFPAGGGIPAREAISFEIERFDLVTVEVLDSKGADVARLAYRHPLGAYQTYTRFWDGRRDAPDPAGQPAGTPAPYGEYHVRILLSGRKLEIRSPSNLQLVRR